MRYSVKEDSGVWLVADQRGRIVGEYSQYAFAARQAEYLNYGARFTAHPSLVPSGTERS